MFRDRVKEILENRPWKVDIICENGATVFSFLLDTIDNSAWETILEHLATMETKNRENTLRLRLKELQKEMEKIKKELNSI